MGSQTVGFIPLIKGDEVVEWTVVDEDTFLWVKQRRWGFDGRYAYNSHRAPCGEPGKQGTLLRCLLHRELMRLGYGDKRVVDHINGDKLDNRLENLRVLTQAQNGQNKPNYRDSTSKYRGVSWYEPRKRWRVAIMVNGKRTLVGYFDDEDEAGAAAHAFYEAHVPYRRQELTTAVLRPGVGNSGLVEPHLVTVNPIKKEVV